MLRDDGLAAENVRNGVVRRLSQLHPFRRFQPLPVGLGNDLAQRPFLEKAQLVQLLPPDLGFGGILELLRPGLVDDVADLVLVESAAEAFFPFGDRFVPLF